MNQDLRNAYPALALMEERLAHPAYVLEPGKPPARLRRRPEGRMTYRRGTIAYVVVIACALFGISWCQERKR